ncbi:MAG: Hsp20/alpha crystallin family protein [Nitriliruptor sp.]|nr:MAG: Hsp20/alpha crystallin family protein [Nitriliruptor sp.]
MTNGLTRTSGFRDVAPMHDEMERVLRQVFGDRQGASSAGAFSPALDVEEDENAFTLHVELPSVNPDDVEVSLEENVLTIAGERRFYDDKTADGFRRVERHFGRFHRSVRLPDRVDANAVEANYHNGLLTITVPKAEEAKPRRIQINAN